AAGIGGALAAVAPATMRPLVAGGATSVVGLGGLLAGAAALAGQEWSASIPGLLPLGSLSLAVDALSGAFLLLIGAVAVAVGIYSVGYTGPGGQHATDDAAHPHVPTGLDVPRGAGSRTA